MLLPNYFWYLLLLISTVFATYDYKYGNENHKDADRIQYIPGIWPQPEFAQYSGYVSGVTQNYQLHYWLVEAEEDSHIAPLILWLNGGPGCSSLNGLLYENGPFQLVSGGKLVRNSYSWNKIANVLYLESPAGVGFSYAQDGNVSTDDDLTALNNYHALINFFDRFPEFKNRDFYIIGESYGGVYVPTLALHVLNATYMNLKGIAVGNGLTSYKLNDNSLLYFLNFHGLVDESTWIELVTKCCGVKTKTRCMFTDSTDQDCQSMINYMSQTALSGINPYNIYSQCMNSSSTSYLTKLWKNSDLSSHSYVHSDFGNYFRNNIYMTFKRNLFSYLRSSTNVRLVIPCADDRDIRNYLNSPVVQEFIHVKINSTKEWDVCDDAVNFQYVRNYEDLKPQYTQLLQSKIPVLIYNGDIDGVCNTIGDEWFVDDLNAQVVSRKQSWLYLDEDQSEQVGGFKKVFKLGETPLIFTTIRGAGHMVPQDKPIPTLDMIQKFITSSLHK